MKKVLKWIGIILGSLLILIILAAVGLSIAGGARLNKTQEIQAEALSIPSDEAALARGEHLVYAACSSCHGPDLSGQPLLDDPAVGTVFASNLTGLGDTRTDDDLVVAIRHAVGPDGRQLVIMPAESFIYFSAEDLGAVIAYLKTVPAIENDLPEPELTFMGRILLTAGMFGQIFPAEYIDHSQPFPEMPEVGANVAYGEYISRFCTACHGAELTGGPPADPDSPPAPNLTMSGRLGGWSEAEFFEAMRTGVTPDGRQLDPEAMPWESFGKFEDDELQGVWLYLQTQNQ